MRTPIRRLWLALLVMLVGPATACPALLAQTRSTRTVLTVHWSTEDYPSTPIVDAAIRQALRSDPAFSIDYFAEYLESDRFPDEKASLALRDYIKQKFSGRRIDVVLAVSQPALDFVQRYCAELFPDAPVVASVTTAPAAEVRVAGAGITGIVSGVAYGQTLELALRLHPDTRRVFVVAYAPTMKLADTVRAELEAFTDRVALTYIDDSSVDRVLSAIALIPRDSLVLFVRHSQEKPGEVLFPADVARLVSEVSPVPVYGQIESYLGSGIVGGVVTARETLGLRLGQLSRQLLAGVPAQDLPMELAPVMPTLDWRQLQRWHIASTRIPPGTAERFRAPTAWEQYRGYFLSAAALLLAQSALIGALLVQRTRRRRAEAALEQARTELNRVARLTALGEFAAAIAHEVRQPLQAIIFNARSCLHRLGALAPDVEEVRAGLLDVVEAGQRAGEVIQRNRELFRSHSVVAMPLDINAVIEETILLARTRLTEQHVTLTTSLANDLPVISGDRIELQQVLLNLCANAIDAMEWVSHQTRRIDVVSSRTTDGVQVTVTDTGIGFKDVDLQQMFSLSYTTKPHGTGVGLAISRSIIEAHGGRLWAEPAAGGGATFCFSLPSGDRRVVSPSQ